MNSWEQAVETVKRCVGAGIREYVVCAGARNAVLIEALTRAESAGQVTLRRHFEERSAGFFALGRTIAGDEPCAVVTTSGTAVAELLPAMIEASYQGRPLVALTADRPASFRGSGSPQTIHQPGIFGGHAGSGDLTEWDRRSPWHVNVEFDEDFTPGDWDGSITTVEDGGASWPRLSVADLALWLKEDLFRGLVVMVGELEPEDREDVFHFLHDLKVPVVAEATSGLREALGGLVLPDPDRTLKAEPPGKVLRLGAVPSGRFWRDLENHSDVEVWNVTRSPYPGIARDSRLTIGPIGRVIRALGEIEQADDALDHLVNASRRAAEMDELLEAHPDSEPGMLRTLSHYAALGSGVFLGNSLPIREWNLFAQRDCPVPEVRANRGVNGIDGQVSTWLGVSAARKDAWCVIGDLTALYDLAAPAVFGQIECQGRMLVVIQNGGGQIFDRLPAMAGMSVRTREIMRNRQEASLEHWAALWGMKHVRITSIEGFDELEPGGDPTLVELIPSESETRLFWEKWDTLA